MASNKFVKTLVISIVLLFLLSGALQFSAAPSSAHSSGLIPSESNHMVPVSGRGTHPIGQEINVNNLYTKEPAPMGIADYGLEPAASPYNYSSSSFLGVVNIKNLETYNASLNSSATELTFQLNINFVFYEGSREYVYWVQNVAYLNTSSTPSIGFIDNVWNISGPNANVYNSTLTGNGTVSNSSGTFFYYSSANQSLPGNDVYVSYPFTFEMAINYTSTSHGIPEVVFTYNDGPGWQTYDNVLFNFATTVTDIQGFVVNGYNYESNGYSFYDAELILGGPGDGTQTNDTSSSLSLQLEYFNGHNYQMVTNAYNFGSNTTKGISNVISTAKYYDANGSLFASIQNGSGQLGQLYSRSQVSILNVTTGVSSGYVMVNNTRYNFVGGDANVTLAAGTYKIEVYRSNGSLIYQANETLAAGDYKSLSAISTYKVTFVSSGLPTGATWQLNISNGQSFKSSATNISVDLANGSYEYNASSGGKYLAAGIFNVSGAGETVYVVFKTATEKQYEILFMESGLATGTSWTVTLNGTNESSSSSTMIFNATNGTYAYTIGAVSGYIQTPQTGDVKVSGKNVTVSVLFTPVIIPSKYNVTFVETGLVGVVWFVNLTNGQSNSSSTSSINFMLPNGTYAFSVSSGSSLFGPTPSQGTFTVNGAAQRINVTFSGVPLSLTFEETGLPSGASWSVTLNGTTKSSTSSTIMFLVLMGTYVYSISPPSGFTTAQTSGTVKLVTPSEVVRVTFSPVEYNVTFLASGLTSGTTWTVTFNGTWVTTSLDSVTFSVPNGTYAFTIANPTGYTVEPGYGSITVAGYSTTESIVFSAIPSVGYLTGSVTPANVTIYVDGQTYTQTNGQFNITLPVGTYEVKVSAPGYSTYTANISVSSSAATQMNTLSLKKTSTSSNSSPAPDEIIVLVIIVMIMAVLAGVGMALRSRRKK
ncbi:MAG: thermopsin family protease [Candidatus Micrarchaeaceae archaeon]